MGILISVEGGEYMGKSSVVVPFLSSLFFKAGCNVLVANDPGGTPEAMKFRDEAFRRAREGAGSDEIAQIFFKARGNLIETAVKPFPKKFDKGVVILDRYLDTPLVYQGQIGKVGVNYILDLHRKHTGFLLPDLTFLLHVPQEKLKAILKSRIHSSGKDKSRNRTIFDESPLATHLKRQEFFLGLPKVFEKLNIKRNFATLDASVRRSDVKKQCEIVCASLLNTIGLRKLDPSKST